MFCSFPLPFSAGARSDGLVGAWLPAPLRIDCEQAGETLLALLWRVPCSCQGQKRGRGHAFCAGAGMPSGLAKPTTT